MSGLKETRMCISIKNKFYIISFYINCKVYKQVYMIKEEEIRFK